MISVVILTKNSESTIVDLLKKLTVFDEVLILDTGSTDNTIDKAKTFSNVSVHSYAFEGFGILKNKGASLAKQDWIFSLDSDEIPTDQLISHLTSITLNPNAIYNFPFHNYFNGKKIKGCGWHPDYHIRLYNKKKTHFSQDFVHEKILKKELKVITVPYPINHFSYRSIDDFLIKMHRYSSLFAEQNHKKKKSSFTKALFHGFFAFFKSYLLKRGFIDGKEGFIISFYNAQTAFYKYLKLAEKNGSCF